MHMKPRAAMTMGTKLRVWADLEDTDDEEEDDCSSQDNNIADNYKALEMQTG